MNRILKQDISDVIESIKNWESLSYKTILVTGASGFMASTIIDLLLSVNKTYNLNCKVYGLLRNIEKGKENIFLNEDPNFSFIVSDVIDVIDQGVNFDIIFHAASNASPKFYGKDPVGTMTANIIGTYKLLELTKRWGTTEFIYFSSAEVYGISHEHSKPTAEQDYGYIDIGQVRSCYSESKRASETLGISYNHQFGSPFKIIRPFHTYGPKIDLNDGRVFADFVRDIINGLDLVIHSDGKAQRAFCYISDAISAIFHILFYGENGLSYNIGNPNGLLSINDLAKILLTLRPKTSTTVNRIVLDQKDYIASNISFIAPNIDRLIQLGWSPKTSVRSGFERTIAFFENQYSNNI